MAVNKPSEEVGFSMSCYTAKQFEFLWKSSKIEEVAELLNSYQRAGWECCGHPSWADKVHEVPQALVFIKFRRPKKETN